MNCSKMAIKPSKINLVGFNECFSSDDDNFDYFKIGGKKKNTENVDTKVFENGLYVVDEVNRES